MSVRVRPRCGPVRCARRRARHLACQRRRSPRQARLRRTPRRSFRKCRRRMRRRRRRTASSAYARTFRATRNPSRRARATTKTRPPSSVGVAPCAGVPRRHLLPLPPRRQRVVRPIHARAARNALHSASSDAAPVCTIMLGLVLYRLMPSVATCWFRAAPRTAHGCQKLRCIL